jgi:CheY-like chemotaxis protein
MSLHSRKTVLIVDDNADVREICTLALGHAGYRVLEASDGQQGVWMARDQRPELVVMDGKMPVLGGWDAVRILKADPLTARIPVVAFTASAATSTQYRALSELTDGYIMKPCYPSDFVRAVHGFIGPPGAGTRD